jgi:predicted tellurium resistance membrane protein TerC
MITSTKSHSDFFYRAFAAVAIIAPILLVFAAGTLPEGLERSDRIVYGHAVLLVVLATGLVLRAVYTWGFSRALYKLQTQSRITHVTA